MKGRWTKLLPMFAVAASLLTGCGGASGSSKSMKTADSVAPAENSAAQMDSYSNGVAGSSYSEASAEIAMEEEKGVTDAGEQDGTSGMDSMTLLEEKLVYHCNLEIETLDYPATMTAIKTTITKYGGVIQSESESDSGHDWYYENYRKMSGTMHNYLEVRIPSKDYNHFLAELDGVGKVISKSTSVDNISQRYYDTIAQIEALQIQEKNLLVMLEKCETIEDMITVEQRLSEVQYELNNLQTTRRYMDMDVAYSYVNISISEVMEYRQDSEPVRRNTFTDRLKNTVLSTGRGFLSFLEGTLFLVIRLAPYILIIAVIGLVFFRDKIKRFKESWTARRESRTQGGQNRIASAMPSSHNPGWQTSPAVSTPLVDPQPSKEQVSPCETSQTTQNLQEIPQPSQEMVQAPQECQETPQEHSEQ